MLLASAVKVRRRRRLEFRGGRRCRRRTVKAEPKDLVLDGAGAVKTPGIGRDALGLLDLERPLGAMAVTWPVEL
jgi:hypothetical protein